MASSDIEKIERFAQKLDKHEVPPDDKEQEVIERVGDTHDPSALPALRRVLSAAIEYQRWSESLSKKVGPNAPGVTSVWIMGLMASKMESRLRSAIEKCTPEGEPVVYEPQKR